MRRRAGFLTDVTRNERVLLDAGLRTLGCDEEAGQAIQLKVDRKGRTWVLESASGTLVVEWPDRTRRPLPDGFLALSDRLSSFMVNFPSDDIELTLPEPGTVVAWAGSVRAAIDLVPQDPTTPRPVVMTRIDAEAVVPLMGFGPMLGAARIMPTGIDHINHPSPPMWLQIAAGSVGLHVDWNDFLPSRATYYLDLPDASGVGSTRGQATIAAPHALLEDFLHRLLRFDNEGDDAVVRLTVGTASWGADERPAIEVSGRHWRLVLNLVDPMEQRWGDRLDEVLAEAGLATLEHVENEWLVVCDGDEARVTIHHGHPDVARVSAVALTQASESLELLRELSSLNAASVGVRYWLEDGTVFIATDLPCTLLAEVPSAVRRVVDARRAYSPLLGIFGLT